MPGKQKVSKKSNADLPFHVPFLYKGAESNKPQQQQPSTQTNSQAPQTQQPQPQP
jgi:hypothetical protein